MIENLLEDKTIIITNPNIKRHLLIYISEKLGLVDIKILNKKELLEDITFSYTKDILYYMNNKYKINIDVCKNMLDNLYYINDSNQELKNIKNDLIENNKIIKSTSILNNYKKIIFYNIDIDPFYEDKIREINNNIEIIKIHEYENKNNKSYIYEAKDIEEEVMYFFDKCYELINNGIDINKIKLVISDNEYYTYLENYSNLYNIGINLNEKKSIYSYGITLKILSRYKDGESLEDIIKSYDSVEVEIISKVVDIINKYDWNNYIYDVLVYEFKHTYISNMKTKNEIEVIDINNAYIGNDEYLFILGFNQNLIPKIIKDDDFLKDSEKTELKLYTSIEINKQNIANIKRNIRYSKETYISYKLKTPFNSYVKSSILDELDLINDKHNHNYKISPSKEFDKYMFSSKIDKLYKYNKKDENLELLLSNVKNDFGKYDNKYKKIDSNTLKKLLGNELKLSYTSINSYYECRFKYYLKYILKIKEDRTNIDSLFLGNLFHYVLSKVFVNGNKDELIDEFIKLEGKELSTKDKLYLNKYKNELTLLIDVINENKNRSHFKDLYYEKDINLYDNKNIKITLTGKIDKILSFDDGICTYLIIIDYKTGNLKVDYNNIVYGLNMQLFMYAYLLKKCNLIKNSKIAGFYLQNIGHDLIKKQDDKLIEDLIKEEYKLHGYSIENIDIMEHFDNDLSSLKKLKVNKDGTFSNNSLVFNDALLDKFIGIVDEKAKNAIDNITKGNFDINPKELNDKNISCEYCKYFDICYKKHKDIEVLKEIDIEDYVEAGD